jgi:peptidoglycan hydrolase CwlO-like protein
MERYLDRTPTKRDWILPLAIAGLSITMSAFAAYNNNDKAITSRVVVIETQQKNDGARLERIENKIDKLDDKVDRILKEVD